MEILSLGGGRRLCLFQSYNSKIKVKFSLLSQRTIHHFYKHKHVLSHNVYKSVSQKLLSAKAGTLLTLAVFALLRSLNKQCILDKNCKQQHLQVCTFKLFLYQRSISTEIPVQQIWTLALFQTLHEFSVVSLDFEYLFSSSVT